MMCKKDEIPTKTAENKKHWRISLARMEMERLLQREFASPNLLQASNSVGGGSGGEIERSPLVKVKSSQKIFTDAEVASLTGICVEHLHNFARSRHLGMIARAAEAAGVQAEQWLFTLSDLMVLVTLFPRCSH